MELYQAHHQWANRPADERFASLEAMHETTKGYADRASESRIPWALLRADADGNDLYLTRGQGTARIGHYAFGQLANRIAAPASYLRQLPATLAAQNLNHGLKTRAPGGEAQLLFHSNGERVLRAATSETYTRIWNHEVIERLLDLSARTGLVPARPTFRETGDDAPALYASDHDMFAFLMSGQREVRGPLGDQLFRGIIVVNSEVGAAALRVLAFYFRAICGNHIIWGAEEIAEVRLIHRSGIRQNWLDAQVRVRRYLDASETFDRARFSEMLVKIADTKDAVLDRVFGKMKGQITRRALDAGYDAVVPGEDGSPRSVYGLAQGITRHSQTLSYADERTALDRAAGKLMSLTF